MTLERFSEVWGANTDAKNDVWIIFCDVFFRVRFGTDFSSISGDSDLGKSTKTIVFSMVFVDFQKIDVCETYPKIW